MDIFEELQCQYEDEDYRTFTLTDLMTDDTIELEVIEEELKEMLMAVEIVFAEEEEDEVF